MPPKSRKARARRSRNPPPGVVTQAALPIVSRRAALLCSLLVFSVLLAIYTATLLPTVIDQDSGELIAAAHVLGIAHPTGYPLWTLLGRLFDLLPLGHTSAYRVAMLSAVAAAAASGIIAWIAISLTRGLFLGVFAGFAFGLWFPTWSQAVRAEVYALSGLLFSLFLVALLRWDKHRTRRSLCWLALAAGFVSMHHRTAFLAAAPSLAAAFWLTRPRRVSTWAYSTALLAAPFLAYLYLPIRAAARPVVNWGDPSTLDRFLDHALGRQYHPWVFRNSFEVVMQQAVKLTGESLAGPGALSVLLALVGGPLVVWGFLTWYRRQPVVAVSLGSASLMLAVWVLKWGEVSDLKVFLQPLGAVVALAGGLGAARLGTRVQKRGFRHLGAVLGALVCGILVFANWERSDQSGLWKYRDLNAAALMQMDKNAIYVVEFDNPNFAVCYLQSVEGIRQDITVIRPHGLWQPWYVNLIQDPELRRVADEMWEQITREQRISNSHSPEFYQGVAVFAYRLAQHYRGRRTIYTLHGPYKEALGGPPYFVGLTRNLISMDFTLPEMLRPNQVKPPLAEFSGGVKLLAFQFETASAYPGERVAFRTRWQLESPLQGSLFAVKLTPSDPARAVGRLQERGAFLQGFPPLYGLWGSQASPPDTGYEQQNVFLIPSNAPAGDYMLQVGFATVYPPPQYEDWTRVGSLTVRARPLPTNGP